MENKKWGFRSYVKGPGFQLVRVGSWDSPQYPRFGMWGRRWMLALRWRGTILHLGKS